MIHLAVNDISWSPDGRRLVTCSLSSEVFVWDISASSGRAILAAKLIGHTGFVKGVAWDPLNHFIATEVLTSLKEIVDIFAHDFPPGNEQADDKTVIIWRTSDWDKEAVFSKPYRNSSSNCFFRRLGSGTSSLSLSKVNLSYG